MNHFRKEFFFITLLATYVSSSFSQELTKKEFIKAVQEADISYLYDKDYERASGLYEPLQKANPGNANLAARLGICYLNLDGKKQDALRLLKEASKNVAVDDKEYVFYGEKAQMDTYLYLAVAYQMNDSLEKALSIYNEARKKLGKFDAPQEEYIDVQVGSCYYALAMKKKPLTIISELFAPWLKDYPGACNPVLAKNDSVFIFTQKTAGKTRILCSYKSNGQWGLPSDITKQIGGLDRFYSNSITGDGKLLVLFLDDGGDGNLYFCHRKDTTWTKIKSPGKPINTIYWESHGFITPDGNTIYIATNRPGGIGDLDIWVSSKLPDGSWADAVNCGEVINTSGNEDTPFFDPVNNALIFSSEGHVSMGGYDVFRSTKRYDSWTNPVGMPYAFNTTTQNTFFILNNNAPGFVASRFDEKSKTRNIYGLVAIDPNDEITTAEGGITLKDGMAVDPKKALIKLTDVKKKTPAKVIPVKDDGTYKFEITPGDYMLLVSHPGYKPDTINMSLPLYFLSKYMVVNSTLIPEKVADGSFLSIKNVLFAFDSYKLDDQAISVLESLKPILLSNPGLKIEVAGYTDALGSTDYNLKLSGKRAKAVIDYLVSTAIPASRLILKSFGESNFAAINSNHDGSDNPEGRKYNRRVTFGIVDPKTGIILRQETYTPEHLRMVSAMKYSIVLKHSTESLSPGFFDGLKLNGVLFVRTIDSDSQFIYAIGVFYNKTDAINYLEYVREKGFTDAYIVNQYELNKGINKQGKFTPPVNQPDGKKIYTIQIIATRSPVNMNQFNKFQGVREIIGEDGYYRYVTGEYTQFAKAKEALREYKEAGFSDAFIRELDQLIIK
ncbi:MAG: OmpA family protein [Bacteroidales bacterium]|jgi:outer membrane protein OmpA-like peptidoglycan-associated protein|nr:OmpA family protein [Bacteroidales bacterium]